MTAADDADDSAAAAPARRAVLRNAAAIALTTGAYALSFGAVGVAGGLSVWQTCVLSLLMFSGGSQFAFVGVIGGGGAAGSAVSVAMLLGARNAFYGIRLAPLLDVRGPRRILTSQFVIDETTAMTVGQSSARLQQYAFWTTGLMLFALWNLGTLVGALGAGALADPRVMGMDAAAPAAFLALLWPRLREAGTVPVALAGAAVCLAAVPFVPAGVPILLAAGVAIVAGAVTGRRRP